MTRFTIAAAALLALTGAASANSDLVTRNVPASDVMTTVDLTSANLRADDKITVTTGLVGKTRAADVLDTKDLTAFNLTGSEEISVTVFDNGLRVQTFER